MQKRFLKKKNNEDRYKDIINDVIKLPIEYDGNIEYFSNITYNIKIDYLKDFIEVFIKNKQIFFDMENIM